MSNIKKFRIKSFKNKNVILKLDKLFLKFGKKIILDNLDLELSIDHSYIQDLLSYAKCQCKNQVWNNYREDFVRNLQHSKIC